MKKISKIAILLIILLVIININSFKSKANQVNFLPYESKEFGRNSNAYLSLYGIPTSQMKKDFVKEISKYAIQANEKWGIPASAIIGMAILESGYGTTRIAVNANNLFGVKVWGYNPNFAWQLKGQPDEDYEPIPVIANYGEDRIVYNESKRRDNWYRKFDSYKEAVDYLASNFLLSQRYSFAKTNYDQRIKNGTSLDKASKDYLFDIANAGYNHLGGKFYRDQVGALIDEWNLTQYDNVKFRDVRGHWAEKEIMFLEEMGWISGYSDESFKPNKSLTRAEAAKIINNYLELSPTDETISFSDVNAGFWAEEPIRLVAQNKIMNGVGEGRFAPNNILTRAEMAQIFYNAGFYSESAHNLVNSYIDVDGSFWAYTAIETMKQEGIMVGLTDNQFGPKEPTSRAQMAAIIYRLYEKGLNK